MGTTGRQRVRLVRDRTSGGTQLGYLHGTSPMDGHDTPLARIRLSCTAPCWLYARAAARGADHRKRGPGELCLWQGRPGQCPLPPGEGSGLGHRHQAHDPQRTRRGRGGGRPDADQPIRVHADLIPAAAGWDAAGRPDRGMAGTRSRVRGCIRPRSRPSPCQTCPRSASGWSAVSRTIPRRRPAPTARASPSDFIAALGLHFRLRRPTPSPPP